MSSMHDTIGITRPEDVLKHGKRKQLSLLQKSKAKRPRSNLGTEDVVMVWCDIAIIMIDVVYNISIRPSWKN